MTTENQNAAEKKVMGIIGGVGPMATAYFMERVIALTKAEVDQQHIDMIVLNHCSIPDRTAHILDQSKPDPGPVMAADAQKLAQMGAKVIVLTCNTAHYFYEEINRDLPVPFLNMITLTAEELKREKAVRVGIMATTGTVQTQLMQQALSAVGIESVVPAPEYQALVMKLIYQEVKAGIPVSMADFYAVSDHLTAQGCDRIILSCTELSVINQQYHLPNLYIDSLDVLALQAILACGYPINQKAIADKGFVLVD
jgi:aspartate racemase